MRPNKLLLTLFLSVTIAGCNLKNIKSSIAQFGSGSRIEAYNTSTDKGLVSVFYTVSSDGKSDGLTAELEKNGYSLSEINRSSLSINKQVYNAMNMGLVYDHMSRFSPDLDSILIKKYVQFAKSRGNLVKVYRPAMTNKINSLFKLPIKSGKQTAEWTDKGNALIEYSPEV